MWWGLAFGSPLGPWLFFGGEPKASRKAAGPGAWGLDVSVAGPLPLNYDLRWDQP